MLEVINKVGIENMSFQKLSDCASGQISTNKKGVTTISFKTDAVSCGDFVTGRAKRIGIILWLDTEKLNEALK